MSEASPLTAPRWARIARQVAPLLVAGAVVAVLLARYSLGDVVRQLERPGALLVPPIILAVSLASLVALSIGDRMVLGPLIGPVTVWDLARARAGNAVLVGLHHGLSAGGYGLWLVRISGAAMSIGVAAIAFLTASDLAAGCAAALAGALAGGAPPGEARSLVLVLLVVGLAVTVGAGVIGGRLIGTWSAERRTAGRWWRSARALTAPWTQVPPAAFVAGLAFRLLNVGIWIAGTWAAARAFGLPLSFGAMAANLPLVAIVAALPLSVGGLGAAQGAWVVAFAPWVAGEEILAFQFVLHWSATLAFVVRGLPFVRRVLREIEDGRWPAAGRDAG